MSTPNMSLPVPSVGSTAGPDYATDINACMTLIDAHDHSSGNGVKITPSGLNINAALTFANNSATNVAAVSFYLQAADPATNGSAYYKGVDLYFKDGNGNVIQMTKNGSVGAATGSISGLTSPASASYTTLSKTFTWQSNINAAANLDCGSVILRNISPNSTFGLTLSAPANLGSNYTLTLPSIPAAQQFLAVDTSGNVTGYANVSAGITGSMIASNTITRANLAAVGQQKSSSGLFFTSSSAVFSAVTNGSVTITTTGRPVMIMIQADTTTSDSFSIHTPGSGSIRILKNSSQFIADLTYFATGSPPSIVLDTPAAGTYTYSLEAAGDGTDTFTISGAQLVAYEL